MASYDNNLRIKEIATGAEAGSWGSSTNTNLSLIGDALGYATEATFDSDANKTVTVGDATVSPYRSMYVKVTSTATLSTTRTLTIGPNTIKRVMFIENATLGNQYINVSQGSGANASIPNGAVMCVYLDGAGAGAAVASVFHNFVATDFIQIKGNTPSLLIGEGEAEDTRLVFNGNAQNYHVGLDDTDDTLKIGRGATIGTNTDLSLATSGKIGIGEDQPSLAKLQVKTGDAGSITLNSGADELLVEGNGDCGISIMQPNDASGRICFGDPDNNDAGEIRYDHDGAGGFVHTSESSFRFKSGSTTLADIETDGDFKLHVANKGIILKSPNGTSYRVTVDNSGNLSTASV
jgi:hypothetical protein